jgi:hypothetical protein
MPKMLLRTQSRAEKEQKTIRYCMKKNFNDILEGVWVFIRTIPYWKLFQEDNYLLFLDDKRIPKDVFNYYEDKEYLSKKWVVVRSHEQFVKCIEENFRKGKFPKKLSYDLADVHIKYYFENGGHRNPPDPLNANFTEKTGYDSAKYLCEFCRINKRLLPNYKIHSANPVGSKNIEAYLENYKKHCE